MKFYLTISLSFLSLCGFTEELISIKNSTGQDPQKYKLNSKEVYIEFGDRISTLTIENAGKYKVFQQTETSIILMDEGPHLDLTNWKHGHSKMIELISNANEFYYINQSKEIPFPDINLD